MTNRKVALVTGASRGIGRAIADQLVADGFDLTISARDPERLKQARDEIATAGGTILAVAGDMSEDDDVVALADAHIARFPRLDLLVLCAGLGSAGTFEDYPLRKFDKQIALHVRSPMLLIQRLLSMLRATAESEPESGSKVIALSSITGVVAELDLAAYGASKAALISLCESITIAEASSGVTATSISPGYVDTDMGRWARDQVSPDVMIRASDIAVLVSAISRLSRYAVVPNIVVTRPGSSLWRA
jgi:NAD(P)-dependent dehydrogenase (short-subunit alcohol dehydrogenase family)